MDRKLSEYQLILFDMDGTLYFQRPLQFHMGLKMLSACTSLRGLQEIKIVLCFRRLRENWNKEQESGGADMDGGQYAVAAEKLGLQPEEVQRCVQKWIYDKPLEIIRKYRDDRLAELVQNLFESGKKIAIYSDYPAEEKRDALQLPKVACFYGGQKEIGCMKPNPKGILKIMAQYQIQRPKEVLIIGDRMSRDGQASINAGADFLILKKYKFQRKSQYKTLIYADSNL
ncbi:MAG: HAD family hydrolase [Clostridium sp.]|nr:HAD family hydrolase [Clostridium sp.]